MPLDLKLTGGVLVRPEGAFAADIGIADGRIAEIGDLSGRESSEEIDATGLHVFPGVIDTQVHFREPGMEHKEDLQTGSTAAIAGGACAVLEMPNTSPPTTTAEALRLKLDRADGRMYCDYGFFIGASSENVGELRELEQLPGVPGVKIFMGSSTGSLLVPTDELLQKVLGSGVRPCPVHAEDHHRLEELKARSTSEKTVFDHPTLRDSECARLATDRLIRAARNARRPVHILHVSTRDELPLIRGAKAEGVPVTAEVTPQHLWFAAPDCYATLGTHAQMNPPIRSREHRDALREALKAGLFDVFGSDHAPHTLEEKALPYPQSPSGMPGVQTLLPAVLTLAVREKLLSLEVASAMLSARPASLYGLKDRGRIEIGWKADLAIVSLREAQVASADRMKSKCGWTPFEGEELVGWPQWVVLSGRVQAHHGEVIGVPRGRPVSFDWK